MRFKANVTSLESLRNLWIGETETVGRRTHWGSKGFVNLSYRSRKDNGDVRTLANVGPILGDFGEFAPGDEPYGEMFAVE
jgi:hypothetical protein